MLRSLSGAIRHVHTGHTNILDELPVEFMQVSERKFTSIYNIVKEKRNPLLSHLFIHSQVPRRKRPIQNHLDRSLGLYISQNDCESALAFLRDVEIANKGSIQMSYDTLESLLLAAKYQNDADTAWQCAQVMSQLYPSGIYSRTWCLLLSVVLSQEHYEALLWIHKEACVPGYVILDDHSYLCMARIASKHGDLSLCRWAALKMRRRQRELGVVDPESTLKLFIHLVEASASASSARFNQDQVFVDKPGPPTIRAAFRFFVRLGDTAARVSAGQLPEMVESLRCVKNQQYAIGIFEKMCGDPTSNELVRILLLNVLLKAVPDAEARNLLSLAQQTGVRYNEETVLLLIDMATRDCDDAAIERLAREQPSLRVINAAMRAAYAVGSDELRQTISHIADGANVRVKCPP